MRVEVNPNDLRWGPIQTRWSISGLRRGGIDHLAHFGDLGRREAADFSVAPDDFFVLGEIDAERLVAGNEGFNPLDIGPELMQRRVGFFRRFAQLIAIKSADGGDVAFDDESFHRTIKAICMAEAMHGMNPAALCDRADRINQTVRFQSLITRVSRS